MGPGISTAGTVLAWGGHLSGADPSRHCLPQQPFGHTECTAECSWKRIRMETRPKTGQGVAALLARVQGAVAHPEWGPRMGVEAEGSMLGSQTRPGQEGTRAWPCSVTLGSSFPTAGMKEAAPAKGAEGCEQDGASGTGARGWVGAD